MYLGEKMCHSGNDVVLCLLLTSAGVTRNDHLSDSWRNQDGSTRLRVRETSINTLVTILYFIYKLHYILAQEINNHIKDSYLCGELCIYHKMLANFKDVNENYMRIRFKVV